MAELHGIAFALRRIAEGKDVDRWTNKLLGHIARGQVDLDQVVARHAALALEMERRGCNHRSILDELPSWPYDTGTVDEGVSTLALYGRCNACWGRLHAVGGQL